MRIAGRSARRLALVIVACAAALVVAMLAGWTVAVAFCAGAAAMAAALIGKGSAPQARANELAALVDATDDAVFGTTPKGVITSWNRGAERIYGWTARETIGQPLEMVVPPATRGAVARSMRELGQGRKAIQHRASGFHRDGHEFDVDLTVCPVYAGGRLIAVSTIARDISSLVQAERDRDGMLTELAAHNEQLRQLDEMKDEFVALVSHELRTPLTSILGYCELVLDGVVGQLNGEQRSMLETVSRNSKRLFRLVDDLLFVARVNSGNLTITIEDVDLAAVAADSVADAQARARLADVTLAFDCDVTPTVRADPVRLAQVFDNLISNAIKFTPAGGRVRLSMAVIGDSVSIVVADSGMGMTPDDQERLFTRFFRTTSAASIQGTGLGLSITKAILDAHHGTIEVESQVGHGTRFTATVPITQEILPRAA